MKKIANIILWFVLAGGIAALVGFAEISHKDIRCSKLDVHLNYQDENCLITADEIRQEVLIAGDSFSGKKISDINIAWIEQMVRENYYIEQAEVYTTLNGNLNVDVTQRRPMARLITPEQKSIYLGKRGFLFPVRTGFTARVPVVNGYLLDNLTAGRHVQDSMFLDGKNNTVELYELMKHIDGSPFLRSLIEQVYINESNQFELIPKVGRQIIIFGDANDMAGKFTKLEIFYREGMKKAGWNKVSSIDLRFKNQVICAK